MEEMFNKKSNLDKYYEQVKILIKPIKSALVEQIIFLTRVIFFWLPGGDVAKGKALAVLHITFGLIVYSIFFTLSKGNLYRLYIFFFFFIAMVQQLIFRGCVITKAEQKLTGLKTTVVDSWIKLGGIEPITETRVVASIVGIGMMTMTLLINIILDQITKIDS